MPSSATRRRRIPLSPPNEDDTIHTSTSNAGVWGSPALTPGARYSFTFQSAGTFTYRCAVHPNMIGIVTVQ